MKNIIVTGSSGFIASYFINKYKEQFNIIPISTRQKNLELIDFSEIEAVVHCAGIAHQSKKIHESRYIEVNTELTGQLATAAKKGGVRHFIFLSSVKVFGTNGWFDDSNKALSVDSNCSPIDGYGKSKLLAEKALLEIEDSNFCVTILRLPLVYGRDAKGNLKLLTWLVDNFSIIPLAIKTSRRSVVSIDNLSEQIAWFICNLESGIFIPQDSNYVSLNTIVKEIARKRNRKIILIYPGKIFINLIKLLLPNFSKRLFGDLAFKLSEDRKQNNYSFKL